MNDVWNNPEYLKNVADFILKEATEQGASDAEVNVGVNKGFSVSARSSSVESVEYNQDKSVDITVYFGQRTGASSLSDLRPEAIKSAVQAACNIARFTDEDKFTGLADKSLMAFNYPDLDLSHPWDISVEQAIELACECEAKALAKDKRLSQAESVSVVTSSAWHVYANTNGFVGVCPATRHEISCVLIAKCGDDMQQGYYYSTACDADRLDSVNKIASKAAERTVQRLGAKRLSTRRVPVIFVAEQARGLLGHFVSAISGGSLYRKASFLLDHLDKPIFPDFIRIDERPHLHGTLGSSPFDNDGVATRNNVFVEAGILKSYILGTYSARKLQMQTTGNAGGVHNLFISTGEKKLSELMKMMGSGLLITELMGQGADLITGTYSRGAAGFWVENGEIQYPVEEITIAGNLKDMYAQIVEVGCDVDTRGNVQTGSILLESMMVAGD